MPDLLVDTTAQRAAAASLRAAARVAEEASEKSGRLGWYVPAAGPGRAAHALADFLGEWCYGMGLIAHQVEVLASYLETAAAAYETADTQLAVAAGGKAAPAPFSASPAPLPEPPARRVLRVDDLPPMAVPITLATATHARQLLPGEPHELTRLAVILRGFAGSAADAVSGLRSLSTGSWQGEAAQAFAGHVQQAPDRLATASESFDAAAAALTRYAQELEDAQRRVAAGFAAWKTAEARAKAETESGIAIVGGLSAQEELAAAAAAVDRARTDVDAAGRLLARVLEDEGHRAPNEPGLLARMSHAVGSFLGGVGEGTVGMVTGVVGLAELAYKLSPQYALIDPRGYLDTVQGLLAGVQVAATHPTETAKVLLDWDTWANDPARAAGRLVPDLLLTLATGGAGAAAKGARGAGAAEELAAVASRADELADVAKLGHLDELSEAGHLDELGDLGHLDDVPLPRPAPDPIPDLSSLRHLEEGTEEWAQAVSELYPVLSKDEVLAIHQYTGGDYKLINGYLRNPDSIAPEMREVIETQASLTREGLANLPRYQGDVFRGTGMSDELFADWEVGATVSDPAFTSSSINHLIAEGFANDARAKGAQNLIMAHIEDASGGAHIERISQFKHEAEVL